MPEKLVHLYPVEGAYLLGEPAEERDVTEAEAKRLLKYQPAAYTTDKPKTTEARPSPATPTEE